MTCLWVEIAAVVVISLISQGGNQKRTGTKSENSHWIYHPHVIEADNYECSHCHARFQRETPHCPKCGTSMIGKTITDENEWIDEEETLDIIFDDD